MLKPETEIKKDTSLPKELVFKKRVCELVASLRISSYIKVYKF